MLATANDIVTAALNLPVKSRAFIIGSLISSLKQKTERQIDEYLIYENNDDLESEGDLVNFFQQSPLAEVNIDLNRKKEFPRDVEL